MEICAVGIADSKEAAMERSEDVYFSLGGMAFVYDKVKQEINIKKHGISFRIAARVFFDEDYIEALDEDNESGETRFDVIGDISVAGRLEEKTVIGNVEKFAGADKDILYVVYTERTRRNLDGKEEEVIRLISARMATDFERGLYYGKAY